MKRKILITAIAIVVLSILLTALFVAVRLTGNNESISTENVKYVVNGKLWGEPEALKSFITPKQIAIQLQAAQLKKDNEMATITATYDWLESGYHYETDNLEVKNNGHTILKGGADTWNLPIFTLAAKHQNGGNIWVDCEDGTFLLVSLLRANGINAWANVGTVEINGSIYGHAWVTVNTNGKEYLLETTLGQSLSELRPVPSFYKVAVKFNEKDVIAVTGEDINKTIYPPLLPAKVQDLKNLLNSQS